LVGKEIKKVQIQNYSNVQTIALLDIIKCCWATNGFQMRCRINETGRYYKTKKELDKPLWNSRKKKKVLVKISCIE
jgi:hypothetical protein